MPTPPLPHKIAVICDIRDETGRILLIKRTKAPNLGLYSPIGGKLDAHTGESPTQCARREIQEEAGVDVPLERLRLAAMISERAYQDEAHWLMFVFRVEGPLRVEAREIREGVLEWREPAELERLPIPRTDRDVIWPLLREHDGRFFAAHIDCEGDELRWSLEQPPR